MNNKASEFEELVQRWLTAPKPPRPPEKAAVPPDRLFRYEAGYQIGALNRLIRVARLR